MINFDYTLWVILILSLLGNVVILIRKQQPKLKEEEYTVLMHALRNILTNYTTIIQPHLKKLESKYDIDPTSKTASIDAYNTDKNSLLSKHAKEIINEHLSDNMRQIVSKYFSDKGIVLHILLQLKSQNNLE